MAWGYPTLSAIRLRPEPSVVVPSCGVIGCNEVPPKRPQTSEAAFGHPLSDF